MKSISFYRTLTIITAILLGITYGCVRQREYIVPTTWSVFPTKEGVMRVYKVMDTTFTLQNQTGIRADYFRKEIQGEKINFDGREVTKLMTYITSDTLSRTDENYTFHRVWALYKDTTKYAELIKENVRELVLRYPMHVDSLYRWDPYLFAETKDKHNLSYRYQNIDTTVTINGMTFEHCVVVRESTRTDERPNSPKYRKAYSIYAPNIGRIYRYFRVIDKTAAGGKIDETTSGVHVETLVEHN